MISTSTQYTGLSETVREQLQVEKDTVDIFKDFLDALDGHHGKLDELLVLYRHRHSKYVKQGLWELPEGGWVIRIFRNCMTTTQLC